jgi:hypothetical protein
MCYCFLQKAAQSGQLLVIIYGQEFGPLHIVEALLAVDPASILLTYTEIALAMLGFAAIASILHGSTTAQGADGRFWIMVHMALVSLTASLIPVPLLASSINPVIIWGGGSTVLFAVSLALIYSVFSVNRSNRNAGMPTNIAVMVLFLIAGLGAVALSLYNCGYFVTPQFWPYLGALTLVQLATAVTFVRVLAVWLGRL